MSGLNAVDFVILIIFFLSTLAGLARGFVREVVSLVTLVVAFIVASMFSNQLAATFTNSQAVQSVVTQASSAIGVSAAQPVSYVAIAISFAVLFAGTVIIGSIVGYLLNIAFQAGILGLGNRLLGAAFGFARGFILNLVFIFVVQLTPFSGESWWQQSKYVNQFQPAVQWLANLVSPSLANIKSRVGAAVGESLQGVGSSVQGITNQFTGFGAGGGKQ